MAAQPPDRERRFGLRARFAVRICRKDLSFPAPMWRWELSSITAPQPLVGMKHGAPAQRRASASRVRAVSPLPAQLCAPGSWSTRSVRACAEECMEGGSEAKLGFPPNFPRSLSFASFLNARSLNRCLPVQSLAENPVLFRLSDLFIFRKRAIT